MWNNHSQNKRKPHLWLIQFIGLIVPQRLRADWRQEWEAELQWRERQLAEWDKFDARNKLDSLWHSAGAFADTLWRQSNRWQDEKKRNNWHSVKQECEP